MTKEYLIDQAKKLSQVNELAAKSYENKEDKLVDQMNTIMLAKEGIINIIGSNNIDMMKDNHANHARFMVSVFKCYDADVLVETVLWVFRAYRSHGFTTNYWATQINNWMKIIKENLSEEDANEILPYYNFMLVNIPIFVKVSNDKLESTDILH